MAVLAAAEKEEFSKKADLLLQMKSFCLYYGAVKSPAYSGAER
jgi:hypothetical protein